MSDLERPVLRPLDAFPVDLQGQKVLCLRDPEGYSTHLVFLQPAAVFMVARMDGSRTVADIQQEFEQSSGRRIERSQIDALVADLDQKLLLDSERFRTAREQAESAFRTATVRPLAHGGRAYDGHADKLRAALDGYLDGHASPPPTGRLRALISPHIDYGRGGSTYGLTYRLLRHQEPFDTFVILGTSHAPTRRLFTATLKDFDTPLGVLENDREFTQHLMDRYRISLTEDEMVHKNEHAIELQTVFLRHLYRDKPIKIVPILVGSFHSMLMAGLSPWEVAAVREFVETLRTTEQALGRRICYIAAADLAHVGTRFGDTEPADEARMAQVAADDARSLEEAAAVQPEGWFRRSIEEQDRRRICGLSPIYTMLRVLLPERLRGELLRYQQCNEPTGSNNVTIAGVAYYES